jgi:hypothetical protein
MHKFTNSQLVLKPLLQGIKLLSLCFLLTSCAPLSKQKLNGNLTRNSSGYSSVKSTKSRMVRTVPVSVARVEVQPTILGFKVPKVLTFSHLTKMLSGKDQSLDQPSTLIPAFPTVANTEEDYFEVQEDSSAIEDERSLMLLSEAEKYAELSETKTLSDIARGSLNRPIDQASTVKKPVTTKVSHVVLAILAFCISALITCGYFVISHLLDDMRVRQSPRFGSMH